VARPTHDEIIRNLTWHVATLYERVKGLGTQLEALGRDVDDLKRELKDASDRRWSLVPPIVGAVVSGLIAALVAYFVARK
jgi:hypothetical protein